MPLKVKGYIVVLTGEEEIEDACRKISLEGDELVREQNCGPLKVYPLYGSLPPHQQQKILNLLQPTQI